LKSLLKLSETVRASTVAFVILLLAVIPILVVPGRAFAANVEGVPAFGNVFVIIGENKELSQINQVDAPYIIGTIKPESAWLTNYFATTHYSEANYVAMTSGQFTACQQLDGSPASCHQNVDNLFRQLDGVGVSWQSWMESMPQSCYLSSFGGDDTLNKYAPKHNPAIFYDNIEGQGGVWSSTNLSAECLSSDIPAGTTGPNDMSTFNAALASGNVARFNFIVPNECEDAHDNCKPPGNPITQLDNFLAREVPQITASPAFGSNGVIIILFDEGIINGPHHADKVGNGGDVMFAVISPLAKIAVYGNGGSFSHYSFLRTMEDGFGISTYLGNATVASPINNIWNA
jgi:acid phosphatase